MTKDDEGRIAYECKWTNALFPKSDVKDLKDESEFLEPHKLGGFSKSDIVMKHLLVWT